MVKIAKETEKQELLKRMVLCQKYSGSETSFKKWRKIRNLVIVLKNFFIITLCKYLPPSRFKNTLYRKTGMKIGKNVSIFGANFDIFFPELIEIGDNSMIGEYSFLITHEFLKKKWNKGKIKIGKNVLVGGMTMILPGIEIGDNSTISAYTFVNKSVPQNCFAGGVPVKMIKRVIK